MVYKVIKPSFASFFSCIHVWNFAILLLEWRPVLLRQVKTKPLIYNQDLHINIIMNLESLAFVWLTWSLGMLPSSVPIFAYIWTQEIGYQILNTCGLIKFMGLFLNKPIASHASKLDCWILRNGCSIYLITYTSLLRRLCYAIYKFTTDTPSTHKSSAYV